MDVRVGCCGFPIRKSEYYREFGVVELQKTFYEPPKKLETVSKWRAEAPEGFEFTLKAWQLITHEPTSPTYRRLSLPIHEEEKPNYGSFKPTDQVFSAWEKIDEICQILGARIIVFQCPASLIPSKENKERMGNFFNSIERRDYIFVWEPRGKWKGEEIRELCEELKLVHCVDPLKQEAVYGDIRYFRLHGLTGYRYQYTQDDLLALRDRAGFEGVRYFMFNNISMAEDAKRFERMVKDVSENVDKAVGG